MGLSYRRHRHSIRLRDFDYSSSEMYFITIVSQDRQCIFGDIVEGKLSINDAGRITEKWINELPNKFSGIVLDKYVIMPNHIHLIIIFVGADLCVCPSSEKSKLPTLATVIQWFKTMSTNEYIRCAKEGTLPRFNKRLWQRNYHDHIIRDYNEFKSKQKYINDNPTNWADDECNPKYGPYYAENLKYFEMEK